jgi:hypothetical protein
LERDPIDGALGEGLIFNMGDICPDLDSGGTLTWRLYASLYEKSPVGNPYIGGIDAKTASFLQEVVWETVKEYFGN